MLINWKEKQIIIFEESKIYKTFKAIKKTIITLFKIFMFIALFCLLTMV